MKLRNILSFATVALLLASCSSVRVITPENGNPSVTPTPNATPVPTPTPSGGFGHITLICDSTCTKAELAALPEIEKTVNDEAHSQCFENYFLDPKTSLTMTNGKTNDQVLKDFQTANIKTEITYYYQRPNIFTGTVVVGYENGDGKIHANRAAWDYYNVKTKSSNVLHELSHKMGYKHNGNSPKGNEKTAPYQANVASEKCYQQP